MIKITIILTAFFIGFIGFSCIYVGAKAEKEFRKYNRTRGK